MAQRIRGRGKRDNIKYQFNKRINSLLCIGQSKHQAKQEYKKYCEENNIKWNPAKTTGIHSIKTTEAYRDAVNNFASWLKENHNEIKYIDNIQKEIAYEYLKHKESQGHSPYSVSRDMSAINKVLDLGLNKKEGGLSQRSYKEITRSREHKEYNNSYNEKNYKEQILVARAFGVRRESINGGQYQIKESSLYQKDGQVFLRVIEKGGRYREAPCLEKYKEDILKTFKVQEGDSMNKQDFINSYNLDDNNTLFDKYTTKIDNHSFRSEYATSLYSQIVSLKEPGELYRGYDKEAIQAVSEALGHNRLNVVVENYLRR